MTWAVQNSAELRRVRDLPRRIGPPPGVDLVAELTEALRTPAGTMRLRPHQALALHDLAVYGGLFAPLGVGEGKTLITLLAPYVLDSRKPLLLLPANLIEKTNRDRVALARHWRIPNHTRLMSVEILGRVQAASELDVYGPDLIVVDEAHRLKNRHAAVTRRVERYVHANPGTRFVALSGTFMQRSLLEFGHILRWCLKEGAPVPGTVHELEQWASALDEDVSGVVGNELGRYEPGALLSLCTSEELAETPLVAARRGFHRRLVDTPGVVATGIDGEHVACSIHISAVLYDVAPVTERHFRTLREDWETPDGWTLEEGVEVWARARELALGMHGIWDPRPPGGREGEWMTARREWFVFVRETLSGSRTLDSDLEVANAVDDGRLDDGGKLARWRAVRDSFVPNPVPVWHDESALRVCAKWMAKAPGIVWTEHNFFAERLSRETGIPYFGAKGLTNTGAFIDDADAKKSAIVSIDANREGRNLQGKWSRNLVVSPPEGAGIWQQMIGRTHRPGQTADEVVVDVFLGCSEHANAFRKAQAAALAVRDTTGAQSKLLLADVEWPTDDEIGRFRGARWGRTGTR